MTKTKRWAANTKLLAHDKFLLAHQPLKVALQQNPHQHDKFLLAHHKIFLVEYIPKLVRLLPRPGIHPGLFNQSAFSSRRLSMADPKHPKSGELVIDASDISTIDLTTEQIRGLTKTREGFGEAVECLKRLSPEQVQTLGLNPVEITRIAGLKVDFDRAEELLGPAEKLVELLRETRMYRGHQVGLVLSEMANQARHRGEKDTQAAQLLGMLGDLMSYIYGPAQKGAAARRDREENEPPTPSEAKPKES